MRTERYLSVNRVPGTYSSPPPQNDKFKMKMNERKRVNIAEERKKKPTLRR